LRERSVDIYASFPAPLVYEHDCLKESGTFDAPVVWTKLLIRVEHLENLFLVNRLLIQRGYNEARADLLSVSLEMVSITLMFWMHMDRWSGIFTDFEWLVLYSPQHGTSNFY
jgi:hypothetical protein